MKQALSIILTVIFTLSLTACTVENSGKKPSETLAPVDFELEELAIPEKYAFFEELYNGQKKAVQRELSSFRTYIAVKSGTRYGFRGLESFEYDYNAAKYVPVMISGRLYAGAEALAAAFGLDYGETGDGLSFSYNEYCFTLCNDRDEVSYDGKTEAFYRPRLIDGKYYIDVENLARLMDYNYGYYEEDGLGFMWTGDRSEDDYNAAKERFEMYDDLIYGGESVECDTTGSGIYEKTDPSERLVGVAYTTWWWKGRDWDNGNTWDIPLLGRYESSDEAVLRQHAIWLRDAGVDFVFVDWSNDIAYNPETDRASRQDFRTIEESTTKLFEVWSKIPGAPKICIFTGPGHVQTASCNCLTNGMMAAKNDQIYNDYVANPDYGDMYFYYEGKPLLMCYAATPSFIQDNVSPYSDDRFTMRWVTGYVGQQSNLFDAETRVSKMFWSWEERGAQTFTVYNGKPEAMTVTAASRPEGEKGGETRDDGATFRKKWARADLIGVKIVLVVSWNEWTTGEQPSPELSKDIEPSETYGTFYLDLMRQEIRKFKGLE